jgi:LysM repeat protein
MTDAGLARPVTLPVVPATAAICPYLLAADGRWRASTPAREHRCTVVSPPAILAAEKQRRLCLTADHVACSTYLAAIGQPTDEIPPAVVQEHGRTRRAVARTVPVVLDHGRLIALPRLRIERGVGQNGLVALMGVAFVAIVVARLSGGGPNLTPAGGAGAASASPTAATSAKPAATARASDAPTRTLVPTEVEPTPVPGEASVAPPPASPRTYKVRSGDTLSGIAGEFGTTWQVLAELNGIDDPGKLRVGQVLQLP